MGEAERTGQEVPQEKKEIMMKKNPKEEKLLDAPAKELARALRHLMKNGQGD